MQQPIVKKILLGATLLILVLVYTNYQQIKLALTDKKTSQTNSQRHAEQLDEIATAVIVTPVKQSNFTIYQYGLGTVIPLNVVEVKSQVQGQLISTEFVEGTTIKAGDLLAQVDNKPFQAQLKLAEGQLAMNQALLKSAQADLKRYRLLLSQKSTSKQTVEAKESLVHQYQSSVDADKGALERARLQLQYTKVIAPISGRLGFRQVDVGNTVGPSSPQGIVTITQLNPISIMFSISEDILPEVLKQMKQIDKVPVAVYDKAMQKQIAQGHLLAVDNQIDINTGTIKLKAVIENTNNQFFANQFVNVKMPIETYYNATLIPTSAIQRGSQGTFVYTVKDDDMAIVTPISISASQGESTAISTELPVGSLVVTQGGDRLKANAKVKIITPDTGMKDNNAL